MVESARQYAPAEADAEAKEKLNVFSELCRTLQVHWPSIGPGIGVVLVVLGAVFMIALTAMGMRHFAGRTAFRGSFREMRMPESLVWLGILFALLAFVDWRWNVPVARNLSWNGGIGLSAVYFLNGLSVLLFVLGTLGPTILAPVALVLVFLTCGQAYPALCFVGLFDTWGEFRGRLVKAIARMRERSEEDKDG
jgi:uncharacterized protein YybS (DUF2232 family)